MKFQKTIKKIPLSRLVAIEIFLGLLGSILSFLLFASLTEDVLGKETLFYDQLISSLIYSFRTPTLTRIMIIITAIGGNVVFIGLTIIVILAIINKHKIEAIIFGLTITAGITLNYLLKLLFHRPRPGLSPLLPTNDFSYPSGHAMNNLILYGFLVFLFYRLTRNKKLSLIVGILAGIWVMVIGFSRIYLGVHFPSDVLGGYLAGAWVLLTALLIDKTIYLHKIR